VDGVTRACTLALALCAGCGDDGTPAPDTEADATTAPGPDATALDCEPPTATFGRCVIQGTTDPCTGADGEVSTFVPISDGDSMDIVLGPQGSDMFVLALRTDGIYAGDGGADNPSVSVLLWLRDEQASAYMAKPSFMDDAGADTVTSQDLFMVIYRPREELAGKPLQAEGSIRDRDDALRCARATFTVR